MINIDSLTSIFTDANIHGNDGQVTGHKMVRYYDRLFKEQLGKTHGGEMAPGEVWLGTE